MSIELSLAEHHEIDKIRHENDDNLTVMLDYTYIAGIRAGMERAAKIADEAAEVSAGWANGADAAARLIREAAK